MRLIHYYGKTSRELGLDDETFAKFNSLPTHGWNSCIKQLGKEKNINCEIHILTNSKKSRAFKHSNLIWFFHPITARFLNILKIQSITNFSLNFFHYLLKNPPDLFVFYSLGSFFSFFIAIWLKINGIPFISMLHSRDIAKNIFVRYIFNNSSKVIVPTFNGKEYLRREFNINVSNIVVIPSGININYFYPEEKKSEDIPYPTICFVGRLEENKGFIEALKCFIEVKKIFPDAILKVAGKFTLEDYKMMAYNIIKENDIGGSVIFNDYITPIKMGDFYRNSHLLLFPSNKEGFGRAIVESMVCGTTAVALIGSGGPDEIISNGSNGILTTSENIIQEVISLLSDPIQLSLLSSNAARDAKMSYSLNTMYDKVKELYNLYL